MLQGEVTPAMTAILNDAAIHVAFLSGMSYEQIVMTFAQQLSKHMPGVAGVEIRMYGQSGMSIRPNPSSRGSEYMPTPKPSVPEVQHTEEDDQIARNLLRGLDIDL